MKTIISMVYKNNCKTNKIYLRKTVNKTKSHKTLTTV